MRKPTFYLCKNKDADQLHGDREADQFMVTAKLISPFVFATRIVQPLYFLNPKFLASSYPMWLYSLVCVGPGRKPECWFSHDAAHFTKILSCLNMAISNWFTQVKTMKCIDSAKI